MLAKPHCGVRSSGCQPDRELETVHHTTRNKHIQGIALHPVETPPEIP